MTENSNESLQTTPQTNSSTLIEFPGAHRNRPAWRKELSERFREIQQKRAREAALEGEVAPGVESEAGRSVYSSETAKQLGLVPPPPAETVEPNPIVEAALRRIERARRPEMSQPPASRGGATRAPAAAATAAARVFEEEPETAAETRPELFAPRRAEARHAPTPSAEVGVQPPRAEESGAVEAARASSLSVVAPKRSAAQSAPSETAVTSEAAAATNAEAATAATTNAAPARKAEAPAKTETIPVRALDAGEAAAAPDASGVKPPPRRIAGVIDEHWLERHGVETLPKVATTELTYDDRAPRLKRFAAALLDLLVVAFLSAPFAAVIELTISNWGDTRVWGSMAGIVATVMFLYLTCSLALASRTLGMKLFSLHAVDANTAHAPTTGQCARRALVYMLSLATLGIGILYALFDAEGRTAHDLLSRTVVVKQ